jgi:hypothetical protein
MTNPYKAADEISAGNKVPDARPAKEVLEECVDSAIYNSLEKSLDKPKKPKKEKKAKEEVVDKNDYPLNKAVVDKNDYPLNKAVVDNNDYPLNKAVVDKNDYPLWVPHPDDFDKPVRNVWRRGPYSYDHDEDRKRYSDVDVRNILDDCCDQCRSGYGRSRTETRTEADIAARDQELLEMKAKVQKYEQEAKASVESREKMRKDKASVDEMVNKLKEHMKNIQAIEKRLAQQDALIQETVAKVFADISDDEIGYVNNLDL